MVSNRKRKAREAELRFAAEFVRKGYDTYFPIGEFGSTDFVARREGKPYRVQVKATKPREGKLRVKLQSTNNWQDKTYSASEVDLIGAYDYENKRGYLFRLEEFEGQKVVYLRLQPAGNNQQKGVNPAEEYLWFK